jgi:glycosyltransferase involved in cell wall biosynthesis
MTGDTVGGVWTFTLELAEALAAYGIEVVLAAMGGKATAAQVEEAAQIPNLRLFTSDYKLEWMDDPWNDVDASARWLQELEAWFAPDVVHLNTYGHGSVSWRAPVVLSAHSCVLSWWTAVKTEPLPQRWNRYGEAVKQSMRLAQVLVAPSRAMLQAAETHYSSSLPPDRRVIPNGREARKFSTGDKAPFILCAGRLWDEAKNIAAVVEIAPRLPWPVHLAGEASGPNGTVLGVNGCSVLGRLSPSALAEWLSRAAIYVLPARYEPFG